MKMQRLVTAMLAGCAAVVMSSASGLAAHTHDPQHAATDKAKPGSGMAATDHAMMAERGTMMADMQVADQRLDGLIVKMNTASGTEKATATATVVTEMVAQSRTMREGMVKMQQGMMPHMMLPFTMDMPTGSMMSSGCSSRATGTAHVNRSTMTMTGAYSGSHSCSETFASGQMTMTRR